MSYSKASGNVRKFKAKKAKHYQVEAKKTQKRIVKGEQKLHWPIDKLSMAFGDDDLGQCIGSD